MTSIIPIRTMNIVLLQNHLGLGMVFAISLIHLNMIMSIAWQMAETVFSWILQSVFQCALLTVPTFSLEMEIVMGSAILLNVVGTQATAAFLDFPNVE